MKSIYVATPIGTIKVEVVDKGEKTAGGVSVSLLVENDFYPVSVTEFDSEEKELRTVVFKDQENLEDTVEVVHESLPEVKDAEENMVIEPVTMLDYLKQMHPSFGTSIENIQKIVENPLESYLRTEAETLLDGRSKHEKYAEMVDELTEELGNAEPFHNCDWECTIAGQVSDSYDLEMQELIDDEEDEYIMEYIHTGDIYHRYSYIAKRNSDDIGAFLEDTLHRILDHNGTAEDVRRLMGAYIPKEDEFESFSWDDGCIPIDLGYVIPGTIYYNTASV